jgi:UDP-glucose 4-epimerase
MAGFIGSHVGDCLVKRGDRVIGIDNFSGGFHDNVPPGSTCLGMDISNRHDVDDLFQIYKPDYVYHLAAYAAEGLSHHIRYFNYQNNLLGSMNLINAAIKYPVKCFVFMSSIAVYGNLKPPFYEDAAPSPIDPYGISKYAVELDLRAAREYFGLPYVVFRTHNVYGERQNIGDPYRNVIGIFMNKILQGEPLPIFGNGKQVRAFTYVGDIAPQIAESVYLPDARNRTFNLGSDSVCSVMRLARSVSVAMTVDYDYPAEHLPERQEVFEAYCDHTKANTVFGPCVTSLMSGLVPMGLWVKQHGSRKGKPFEGIEVAEKLPPSWMKVLA